MLTLSPQVKVFLAVQPTDMRKSFDSLAAIVQYSSDTDQRKKRLTTYARTFYTGTSQVAKGQPSSIIPGHETMEYKPPLSRRHLGLT